MNSTKPAAIDFPPFPQLTWDGSNWTCSYDSLPAWAGFQGGTDYTSDGTVNLCVDADDEHDPPTPEQVAAYRFLKAHDDSIARAIVDRILREYPALRRSYGDYLDPAGLDQMMPEIQEAEDLKPLIGLVNVHVHRESREGVSFVGFEFECTWDREHGLGVMVHQACVVAYGAADTAFGVQGAERDKRGDERGVDLEFALHWGAVILVALLTLGLLVNLIFAVVQ